jgi:hypothetical protein
VTVRHIFCRYVELGSGQALLDELRQAGVRTKLRPQANGSVKGGVPFGRGALFHLLGNRIYRGDIVHKGEPYAGAHPAIIDQHLWDQVQATIQRNVVERSGGDNVGHRSLLAGRILDGHGRWMSPSHASKAGKRYRYYITPASEVREVDPPASRVPAHDVETIVIARIRRLLNARSDIRQLVRTTDASASALQVALAQAAMLSRKLDDSCQRRAIIDRIVERVQLHDNEVSIAIDTAALLKLLCIEHAIEADPLVISAPACRVRQGKEIRLVMASDDGTTSPNKSLLALVAEAQAFRELALTSRNETIDQLAKRLGRCRSRSAKLIRLSFLAPDIIAAIVEGAPTPFGVRKLLQQAMPSDWVQQREQLGL